MRSVRQAIVESKARLKTALEMTYIVFLSDGRPGDSSGAACDELNSALLLLGERKAHLCTVGFGGWTDNPLHGADFGPLRQLASCADSGMGEFKCAFALTARSALVQCDGLHQGS